MTAKTIMIQGTGSGVGKSMITAALCRRFYMDGRRVAPFKAQNMSLNSFVTEDGGEMGRAQAYQAEACGIKPHVTMNPVLLKPSADNMSQVIVMGKVVSTRNAKNYYADRGKYIDQVKSAFDFLSETYEVIVLEGAGSPAEINLKQYDFVNMAMAKMADAPVIIVGDIDRGGVFAWMKGTYDLLTPDEQHRVKGFIINKFRGDIELLKPGIAMFEKMVGKPVLGTVPFYLDFYIDEEDSTPIINHPANRNGVLDVAVIRLPRMSNFTDVSPLSNDPSISVRYVWQTSQINQPDLIIIPGSKNTIEDLQFMESQGLAKSIIDCHKSGSVILGICGGFQILGNSICDPDHIESTHSQISGLNFFDIKTTMLKEKITRQTTIATCASPLFDSGLNVEGYEIHMGNTQINGNYHPLFEGMNGEDTRHLGITNSDGSVIGTYIHGILDNDQVRTSFLKQVRKRRGLKHESFDYAAFRKQQLDRLCEITNHLDMDHIYKMVNEK